MSKVEKITERNNNRSQLKASLNTATGTDSNNNNNNNNNGRGGTLSLGRLTIRAMKDSDEMLKKIIKDKDLVMYFREFLHTHYNSENLSFWLEIEDLKRIPESQVAKR